MVSFHQKYTKTEMIENLLYAWLSHYPNSEEAVWQLYQYKNKAYPELDSQYIAEKLIAISPKNLEYFIAAIEKEGKSYMDKRSIFSANKADRLHPLFERMLQLNPPQKHKLYQQIATIGALEQDLDLALESLQKAAESAKELNVEPKLVSDIFGQAAALALEQHSTQKALTFLAKAREISPENTSLDALKDAIENASPSAPNGKK